MTSRRLLGLTLCILCLIASVSSLCDESTGELYERTPPVYDLGDFIQTSAAGTPTPQS